MILTDGTRKQSRKTIQYLEENGDRIVYHDQDALNAVLYEDWLALEPRWNMQTSLVLIVMKRLMRLTKNYMRRNQEPAIIHLLVTINPGIR